MLSIDIYEAFWEKINSSVTIIIHSLFTKIWTLLKTYHCLAKTILILKLMLGKIELLNAKLCNCKIIPEFFALIFERQFVFGKLLY